MPMGRIKFLLGIIKLLYICSMCLLWECEKTQCMGCQGKCLDNAMAGNHLFTVNRAVIAAMSCRGDC